MSDKTSQSGKGEFADLTHGDVSLESLKGYWKKNTNFVILLLAIWAVCSYGAALIAGPLNKLVILGFPFGYYMGAQGSLAIFVLLIVWYARGMNKLDEEYGVKEDE
jgi:putative solute:sodium symporter small subunit